MDRKAIYLESVNQFVSSCSFKILMELLMGFFFFLLNHLNISPLVLSISKEIWP